VDTPTRNDKSREGHEASQFEGQNREGVPTTHSIITVSSARADGQLQPEVLPQLGQAWHDPARTICTPHCMHIGASLVRRLISFGSGGATGVKPASI
jgi:hypothetical protein